MKNKYIFLTAMSHCFTATIAAAQTASPTSSITTNSEPAPGSDIIVTARRRAESLNSVPVAVAVVSGSALGQRGITRVDDLARAIPSLNTRPTSVRRSNSQYELRGISVVDSLITNDPAVGVYVNEVYRSRATGTNQSFYDIDNVQVLYGPQGTLFGRNSSAGAVLINTKKPTHRFEGSIEAGYGNLNRREATGIINVPIGNTLALRLAGQRVVRDGYGTNLTNGHKLANTNTYSGRASLLWQPAPGIENVAIGTYYRAHELGSLAVLYGYQPCTATIRPAASCSSDPAVIGSPSPTLGAALAAYVQNVLPTLGRYQTTLGATLRDFQGFDNAGTAFDRSPDSFERSDNRAVSNTTTARFGDLTLKNILGYSYTKLVSANDLDGTPYNIVETYSFTTNRTFSEELQLQGESKRLNWVVGGLFFREKGRDIQDSIQAVTSDTRQKLLGINKSYAVFAQGTYKILDKLSFTAGGRYTWDKRAADYINPRTIGLLTGTNICSLSPAIDTDGDCIVTQKASFKQPTYTTSLDYKPTANTLLYIAHRYGYRSGGLQARVARVASGALPPFNPETVKDVEIGAKGSVRLFDNVRLQASIAAYKAWYKDLQRSVTVLTGLPTPNPATTTGTVNAGEANVKGVEANATLYLARGLSVGGYFGYVDGFYNDFPLVVAGVASNVRVPFGASKYTAGGNISMTPIDRPEVGRVTLLAGISYRSSYIGENSLPYLDATGLVPEQFNTNLTLSWDDIAGSRFSGQLWMRNATNDRQILGVTSVARSLGVTPGVVAEPRTYGFTVKYSFGR